MGLDALLRTLHGGPYHSYLSLIILQYRWVTCTYFTNPFSAAFGNEVQSNPEPHQPPHLKSVAALP